MDDISNILDMIFQTKRVTTLDDLLSNRNLKECEFIRQLLILKSNPDYVEGMDENADDILKNTPLSSEFLGGIQCGIIMSLALDPYLIPSPHHILLRELWEMAQAIKLEQEVDL